MRASGAVGPRHGLLQGMETFAITVDHPLDGADAPDPKALLAQAIAECLAASLRHCLRKARVELTALRTTVRGTVQRNAGGRLRIAGLHVTLEPDLARAEDRERFARCVALFEDFCTVTASVRAGVPIEVVVAESVPA